MPKRPATFWRMQNLQRGNRKNGHERGKMMKTLMVREMIRQGISSHRLRGLLGSVLVVLVGTPLAGTAGGQLFVANWSSGTIGEYTTSGATVNAALVSGLSKPYGLALDGNGHLFVANLSLGTIGEYTTSGTMVNAALVSGLNTPLGLALDRSGYLFVVNNASGTIGKYTTSGATVNASLISGLNYPLSLALDGNGHLFVVNAGNGTIGEYTTSGATVNASLISGLSGLWGIAVDGDGHLFVSSVCEWHHRGIHDLGSDGECRARFGVEQALWPRVGWERTSVCVECLEWHDRGIHDLGSDSGYLAHFGVDWGTYFHGDRGAGAIVGGFVGAWVGLIDVPAHEAPGAGMSLAQEKKRLEEGDSPDVLQRREAHRVRLGGGRGGCHKKIATRATLFRLRASKLEQEEDELFG